MTPALAITLTVVGVAASAFTVGFVMGRFFEVLQASRWRQKRPSR